MKLREFPGALALGLLASLAAHAALYGGGHEMGGAYAGEILTLALAGLGGFAVAFGALAWSGAARTADGSILGARLAAALPGIGPTLAACALFFALGERIETQHASPAFLVILAVLALASWLVLALARGAVKALARAFIAIARVPFVSREPVFAVAQAPVVICKPAPHLRRRFARPPPVR